MLSSTVTATDISLQLKPSCGSASCCDTDSKKLNISDIAGMHHPEIDSASSCSEASPCCGPSPLARKRVRGTEDEDRPPKGTLGVRQIWVHKDHRKGGIARALVDVAREHFAYGTVVMRPHTAFSQPTSDGLKFALAYSQQETVWAYA
jgi:ESCO1/2 acetyl-transferase